MPIEKTTRSTGNAVTTRGKREPVSKESIVGPPTDERTNVKRTEGTEQCYRRRSNRKREGEAIKEIT